MPEETLERKPSPSDLESLLLNNDLSGLSTENRLAYYKARCDSLHLSYLGKPFDYIMLPGRGQIPARLILYLNAGGSHELLANNYGSTKILETSVDVGIFRARVTVSCPIFGKGTRRLPDGTVNETETIIGVREADDEGYVPIAGLGGDALANAKMKAITKASERAIKKLFGLGEVTEGETSGIRGATVIKAEDIESKLPLLETKFAAGPSSIQPIDNKTNNKGE